MLEDEMLEVEESLDALTLEKLKHLLKEHNMKAVAECQMSHRLMSKTSSMESLDRHNRKAFSPRHQLMSQCQGHRGNGDSAEKWDPLKNSRFLGRRSREEYVPLRKPFVSDVTHCSSHGTVDLPEDKEERNVQPCSWAEAADKEDAENAMQMISFHMRSLNVSLNTTH